MMPNYGTPSYGGNQYGPVYGGPIPVAPKAKQTQPLSPEIIAKLKEKDNGIKIEVSQEDLWRASCTHKENGEASLVYLGTDENGNQVVRCTICGAEFAITDAKDEQVKAAVKLIMDLLQTVKLFYVDAPENLIVQYFQMIPLLDQFAELYKKAMSNFSKYEQAGVNEGYGGTSGYNGFQLLAGMLSNPYGAVYGTQAPPPGYQYGPIPQQPPVYYPPQPQQPVGYPPAPQQQGPYNPYAGSPLMTPAQQPPAQPQTVAPAPPPAPAQPPQGTTVPEVSQTKQFNV